MGVVYDAWQNSLDRRVALKVLPSGVAADNKAFMRFMREAKTAGQLNHDNVVGVYALGIDGHTPYYAMEFVNGETLAQILARIKDTEPESETPFGKRSELAFYSRLATALGERFDRLQEALDSLVPDQREVILLARIERVPMAEVAVRLRRSPGAVAQLLWRALKNLREQFGDTESLHLPDRRFQNRTTPHEP